MIDTAHTPIDRLGLTSIGDDLGADEAHVWMASLDQPANVIAKLAPLLSQDESQRALRYYRPVDRGRFIVRRGILRKIISAYSEAAALERTIFDTYLCFARTRPSLCFHYFRHATLRSHW
jgi:hypothetical protein